MNTVIYSFQVMNLTSRVDTSVSVDLMRGQTDKQMESVTSISQHASFS